MRTKDDLPQKNAARGSKLMILTSGQSRRKPRKLTVSSSQSCCLAIVCFSACGAGGYVLTLHACRRSMRSNDRRPYTATAVKGHASVSFNQEISRVTGHPLLRAVRHRRRRGVQPVSASAVLDIRARGRSRRSRVVLQFGFLHFSASNGTGPPGCELCRRPDR